MIPLSGWVLAVAAVLTSPALWSSLVEGQMPLEVAVTRYLVAVGVCWVALSVMASLALPSPGAARVRSDERPDDGPDRAVPPE